MAGYNELRGLRVKYLSADPANPEDGQVWYNSTTGNLRVQGIGVGAWISATPMITARVDMASSGTQDSAFGAGGYSPVVATTEEYNGSGWSTGGNLGTARYRLAGAGSSVTAGLAAGGGPTGASDATTNATEEYDGSSWTAGGNLNTGRKLLAGFGLLTAAIVAGGYTGPPGIVRDLSESYNGTAWTTTPTINTARGWFAGFGTQTSGIVAAGYSLPATPTGTTHSESWDGSTWTTTSPINTSRYNAGASGSDNTSGLIFGGNSPKTATELWDGSTWTNGTSMATGNQAGMYAGGSKTSAISAGGYGPGGPSTNVAEEYNFGSTTVTAAAWSSGGALNTSRFGLTGFGTQTAAIAANGDTFPPATGRFTNAAEEYNGATWTNIASTNTSTNFAGSSKLSPAGAGSVFGGEPVSARHEYWDGSTWSEQTDMNTPRYASAGAGTQTSSLAMAGIADTDATEEWDGSSWTTTANIPFLTFNTPGAGSQTAAIIFGGNGPSGVNTTAEYNSGTWTAGGNLISPKTNQGGAGTQTAALSFMGSFPTTASVVTTTEGYDGTAWSTRPSAATARRTLGSAGTQTAALGFGGYTPGKTTATEEFTGETITVNPASNLSVS